jgi:hypothetical protein
MSNPEPDNLPDDIPPGRKWSVDLLRPDDAEGVTRLFKSVYGADYPIRAYVEPEILIRENAARRIVSSVARTEEGDIVGHNALFQSAPCKKIYESGAGLVHRHYRGGHGIFNQMIAHGIEVADRDLGVELVFGEPVCNHVFSQRVCWTLKMMARAIEINLMPAAAYSKEKSARGRVSTMLNFRPLRPGPQTLYLPPAYREQIQFFYSGFTDQRTFAVADRPLDPDVATRMEPQVFAFAQVVRIAVPEAGGDFETRLASLESELTGQGIRVFQVWLNLGQPEIGEAVEALRRRGYFFGGPLPRWFDSDGLLLQKVLDPPNWEEMQIHYPKDRRLVEVVKEDWQRQSSASEM